MKKNYWWIMLLCGGIVLFGCSSVQGGQKTGTIELEGNPTTGFTWVYTMSPEGVVREVSNEYIQNKNDQNLVGGGGKFVFVFEAVATGEADLVFSYLRVWEEGIPPVQTVSYKAIVDDEINLTLTK